MIDAVPPTGCCTTYPASMYYHGRPQRQVEVFTARRGRARANGFYMIAPTLGHVILPQHHGGGELLRRQGQLVCALIELRGIRPLTDL